jgi:4-amino-4-deoxy-L-arabinose transferase-like glycosyltransferase
MNSSSRMRAVFVGVALSIWLILMRVVALGSDPYLRLDWSAGLLTDEGFYIHNARNVALFGRAKLDEFNNMFLSPALHSVQMIVFQIWGVGAVQARMISVVCSLLSLALLWDGIRRVFNSQVAITAVLFLGLDHANLLFNRMALMDTPAALGAVAAFYTFVRGMQAKKTHSKGMWLATCGALLGVTVTNRALCLYLLPAPFVALVWGRSRSTTTRADSVMVLVGLTIVLLLYVVGWYLPNRAESAAMSRYYLFEQILPKSLTHLGQNIQHALLGDHRGFMPYLFRHVPVLFVLALLSLTVPILGKRLYSGIATSPAAHRAEVYLVTWLLLGWAILAVISYSPSRYYVTTYPALATCAAFALWRLPELWVALGEPSLRAGVLRTALAWLLVYHAVEAVIHQRGILPRLPTALLLYGLPTAMALAFGLLPHWMRVWNGTALPGVQVKIATAVFGLWLLTNGYWLLDWVRSLSYTQYEMSRWLAQNMPPGSILIGDVAPGLCLDNHLQPVNVIPGLCNGNRPVETMAAKYPGKPLYIAILDGRWKERYWMERYPALVAPEQRLVLARVMRWDIGIYPARKVVN